MFCTYAIRTVADCGSHQEHLCCEAYFPSESNHWSRAISHCKCATSSNQSHTTLPQWQMNDIPTTTAVLLKIVIRSMFHFHRNASITLGRVIDVQRFNVLFAMRVRPKKILCNKIHDCEWGIQHPRSCTVCSLRFSGTRMSTHTCGAERR